LIDYQTLLDSQRSLLSAQDRWNRSRVQAATGLIALYKALGGGW
jgi:outer membrane protein, multidrug efflux system